MTLAMMTTGLRTIAEHAAHDAEHMIDRPVFWGDDGEYYHVRDVFVWRRRVCYTLEHFDGGRFTAFADECASCIFPEDEIDIPAAAI